jgi:predicted transport protein
MPLFVQTDKKLAMIKETTFDLERDLQSVIEANLPSLLGISFVCTEMTVEEFRLDTLAYDEERNAFVIIEYKNGQNYSVVDQGMSYLQVLLSRKADFVLEYNNRFPAHPKKKDDFDWSQTRVIFISPYFTNYQVRAASFRDAPFDMYEVRKYDNSMISLTPIKRSDTKESINSILKGKGESDVTRQVKTYTIDDYFNTGWDATRETYDKLHERIMMQDPSLEVVMTKNYIGYKKGTKKMFHVEMFKAGPSVLFTRAKPEDFKDPEKAVNAVPKAKDMYHQDLSTFWMNGRTSDDLEYAMMLIKQQLKRLGDI